MILGLMIRYLGFGSIAKRHGSLEKIWRRPFGGYSLEEADAKETIPWQKLMYGMLYLPAIITTRRSTGIREPY
jgi:hypothetical protein